MDIKNVVSKYNFSILILRFFAMIIDILIFAVIFLYLELAFEGELNIKMIIRIFSVILIYYSLLEGLTGYTWGKLIMGVKVLNKDLSVPGFLKGIIRTFIKILEFSPFLLFGLVSVIFIFISKDKRRLGDVFTNTYVVRMKDLQLLYYNKEKIDSEELNYTEVICHNVLLNSWIKFINLTKELNIKKIIVKQIIPIIISITFILITYKCSDYINISSNKVLTGCKDKYEITLPEGWDENRKLNSDAIFQLSNEKNKNYIIVISENKEDIIKELTLEQYSNIIKSNIHKSIDNARIENSKNTKINNHKGIQFEITGYMNKIKIRYLYIILETKDNFQQIIAWTLDSNYNYDKEKMLNIIKTFKEDENKFNDNESI
ncbi:hypothetical protein CPAST_c23260 [Clostridium pasteurianum DSM 525 = ATCC 6013]|uniref:RDD domain containing protein n=1 Tax=Clostridium pasteurianum DSM 525 = ATCC 6013 TaxID=1262449 RepID=A0A0H3J394_CLOPA|nr:RDD family protein [Clostridium pasteurianum]AJA48396.1 hypothetical protein CPAST_c23260 [Clostridium pasteurianum DSM 525 = ATCC 6013]AJA52384.1 hypothetical protein CLPA_c23260 [Clostridium pasteurianum DSM 525 = ATCC 6013]AOZ75641.1 hypothetical protein AQ983_11305 [Clostridium pasteurianum DSM 525 = ATCC 6013]AOZ79437.1 hypothetical protein AQ984_11300 [Clostridium pasteurianum]ELP60454.1 hypothetical protein F502_03177 [Clostridium pasteurianum DSM 525 = ATCC 6013]